MHRPGDVLVATIDGPDGFETFGELTTLPTTGHPAVEEESR